MQIGVVRSSRWSVILSREEALEFPPSLQPGSRKLFKYPTYRIKSPPEIILATGFVNSQLNLMGKRGNFEDGGDTVLVLAIITGLLAHIGLHHSYHFPNSSICRPLFGLLGFFVIPCSGLRPCNQ